MPATKRRVSVSIDEQTAREIEEYFYREQEKAAKEHRKLNISRVYDEIIRLGWEQIKRKK